MRPLEVAGDVRTLLLLFGDQLDERYLVDAGLDRRRDAVALCEVAHESSHVPSHVQRTVLFLSAMRHFALQLMSNGWRVHYVPLDAPGNTQSLESELSRLLTMLRPENACFIHPGEWRVLEGVRWRVTPTGCASRWASAADVRPVRMRPRATLLRLHPSSGSASGILFVDKSQPIWYARIGWSDTTGHRRWSVSPGGSAGSPHVPGRQWQHAQEEHGS